MGCFEVYKTKRLSGERSPRWTLVDVPAIAFGGKSAFGVGGLSADQVRSTLVNMAAA